MANIHSVITKANFEFNIFVEDLENVEELCSPEIILSGIPWQIQVHKRKDQQNNFFLDVSLKCSNVKTLSCGSICDIQIAFK